MARTQFYTGLDIGSASIRVAVGQANPGGDGIQIIGAAEGEAQGIAKGSITSIEDAVSSISATLEKVERMTGSPVEHAAVSVSGPQIASQDSHGIVAVAKADGEIKQNDIDRVLEAAQAVATPPNYEILHRIPRSFTVDNQAGVKDPIGMSAMRLEVDAQIIQCPTAQMKNLEKTIYRTGVSIQDIVLGVLASAEAALTKRQKELGVALVNIGSSTTSLLVFEEGDVLHARVMPVGASHITNDVAIGLRVSIDLAEKVKIEFGTAQPEEIQKHDEIHLGELGGEDANVSRKHVAEIIQARVEEIFKMVDHELQQIDRSGLLPAGVILTGGGAKLPGLIEAAKKEFRLPAAVGLPVGFTSAIEKIHDPAFTTALGLVVWAAGDRPSHGVMGGLSSRMDAVGDTVDTMRRWFKRLLP